LLLLLRQVRGLLRHTHTHLHRHLHLHSSLSSHPSWRSISAYSHTTASHYSFTLEHFQISSEELELSLHEHNLLVLVAVLLAVIAASTVPLIVILLRELLPLFVEDSLELLSHLVDRSHRRVVGKAILDEELEVAFECLCRGVLPRLDLALHSSQIHWPADDFRIVWNTKRHVVDGLVERISESRMLLLEKLLDDLFAELELLIVQVSILHRRTTVTPHRHAHLVLLQLLRCFTLLLVSTSSALRP